MAANKIIRQQSAGSLRLQTGWVTMTESTSTRTVSKLDFVVTSILNKTNMKLQPSWTWFHSMKIKLDLGCIVWLLLPITLRRDPQTWLQCNVQKHNGHDWIGCQCEYRMAFLGLAWMTAPQQGTLKSEQRCKQHRRIKFTRQIQSYNSSFKAHSAHHSQTSPRHYIHSCTHRTSCAACMDHKK